MRHRAIKVYGERNSGTNYLSALLALNVDLPRLPGVVPRWLAWSPEWARDLWFAVPGRRWKHATAAPHPGAFVVTIAKNPYAWILSMHRRPYHGPGPVPDLLDFIEAPWPTRRRGGVSGAASPVDLWNAKNRSYLAQPDAVNLRYEDLIADPRGTIIGLAARHGLPRVGPFRDVERGVKGGDHDRSTADYRRYYLSERWREKLRPEHIAAINERLDPDVMHALGYARIEATEAA